MPRPLAVDQMEVLVLVDNSTEALSTSPADTESEISRFWRRGARLQAGPLLCCAVHGFACSITVRVGDLTRTLLFDAGPDGEVLQKNAQRLGFDIGGVDALFLSHGHWDHAGIVNVLSHAPALLPGEPLYGVLGGMHLSGRAERLIPQTVDALRAFGLTRIAPAHGTGWRAVSALAAAFGDAVSPSAAGKAYRL